VFYLSCAPPSIPLTRSRRSREDVVLENLALRRQLLALPLATASHSINCPAQAVLGCVENVLVRIHGELLKLGFDLSEGVSRDGCGEPREMQIPSSNG
jgi:hypothetical protein